ncbi:MAG: hypothetical protein R6V07_15270 [Armatimonadota bacterium]
MSKKMKTGLVVVALLVGIGAFNYIINMDPTQLAARGVGKDAHSHGDDDHDHENEEGAPTFEDMLKPIGPEDAAVTIEVLWGDPQEVQGVLRPMLTGVASSYPDHVRVEFVDPDSERHQQITEEITEGIGVGLLINGEMIKQIPEADLGVLAFAGSPTFEEWSEKDLRLAVEHELEDRGIDFEPTVEHDHRAAPGQAPDPHAGHDH